MIPEYKVEKRYSARANPRRGYHDYEAVVTFEGGTVEEQKAELELIRSSLATDNMWAYPAKPVGPNVWIISFGYDSGD